MRKKIVGILLAAVMLSVAVAGCGNQADGSSTVVDASDNDNGSSSSDSSERQTSGDNTITMMCWYEEGTMDSVIEAINTQLNGEYGQGEIPGADFSGDFVPVLSLRQAGQAVGGDLSGQRSWKNL